MEPFEKVEILDFGYVEMIETWGSDERIVESARMSTAKGFEGWGEWRCGRCSATDSISADESGDVKQCMWCGLGEMRRTVGDEKLLRFLWENQHATPFEMAGATFEVKAPIFVFREWHRHRVPFGYNEMSARYVPLPDENYCPTVERLVEGSKPTRNKQASGSREMSVDDARHAIGLIESTYTELEDVYQRLIALGVSKELARVIIPVGRYSRMRATGNLRGWLGFLRLRQAPGAQWEIRQFANAVHDALVRVFPRTLALFDEGATR